MDSNSSGGITLSGIGFIVWLVFFILKCCDVLSPSFSWFWVWFPLWIIPAINLALLIVFGIIYFFTHLDEM